MASGKAEAKADKPADKPADNKAPAGAARDAGKEGTKDGAKDRPKKPGQRKKLTVIAAAAAVLLSGGGAGAYFMLGKKPAGEALEAHEAPAARKTPVFVDLETFTVNLREPDDDRFMQVKLMAEVKDAAAGDMIKTMMPAVRNEIVLLLGSKQAQDLSTREGKEQLAREIVLAANKPLAGTPADKSIESVNFTHLIIQ